MDPSISSAIQNVSVGIVPFVVAVVFHEISHGWVAKLWGDKTAESQGRLTFNPLPHLDILGTVLLPIFCMATGSLAFIGWAKPVPVDPSRFRKQKAGVITVALAGPATNVLIAIFSALALCGILVFLPHDFYLTEPLSEMAKYSVEINYGFAIFNLLPIPPLDGSRVLEATLPYEAARKYNSFAQYSLWIFLLVIMVPGTLEFLGPPIRFLTVETVRLAASLFFGAHT